MSTPWILYRLYTLNTSSADFLRYFHSLILRDDVEEYLTSLQGPQLARLVDFLDKTLSARSAHDDISRQCLRKLQAICAHRATLPHSCIVSNNQVARVGDHTIALGGYADMWEGTYRRRRVSVKCLKAPLNDDPTLKKSFCKEAVVWKRLRHPNIVPFIGVTTDPLQIVSEWMPNGTLVEFVEKNPGAKRISLLLDVAEGLGYLHANHTIHGNLKGSNILVDHGGHARLANFEFASIVRGTNSVAQTTEYTAAWTAPEIVEGVDTVTREADVFAFGMVVIEIFTGSHPSGELTTPVITSKIMDGGRPARPQEAQGLGLTGSVWDMAIRCLHRNPAQRPKMTEVVRLARECYRMTALWTRIMDIPVKVLMNNILPFCKVKHLRSLGYTNWFFALVVAGETSWRRQLEDDANSIGSMTTRISSWKLIPQRFRNARVSILGRKDEGQLGLKSSIAELPGGGAAQSTKYGTNAAYKLVHGVVRHPRAPQSMALIDTCAEMCRAEGVNFAEVLQDPVFKGRTALHWIIVSKPPPDQYELLSAILNHSRPLSSRTIDEVGLACATIYDQALFSHLWRHPAYHSLSGTHELSFGSTSPADYVGKENTHYYCITYRLEITQFHKRMSTSGRITLRFIHLDELWCLEFYAAPDKKTGTLRPWSISLSITWTRYPNLCPVTIVITKPHQAEIIGVFELEKLPIHFRLNRKFSILGKLGGERMEKVVVHSAENVESSELRHPDSDYYSQDGTLSMVMLTSPPW